MRRSGFSASDSGSVAMTFAIAITVIASMLGLSIDASRYVAVRQSLQESLDAAAVAYAAKRQAGMDGGSAISELMAANWKSPYGAATPVAGASESADKTITANATSSVETTFAKILGFDTLAVSAEALVRYGIKTTDVALAVDVTGSMSGAKISSLKSAAKALTATIYANPAAASKVRLSVVPFADYVNIGTGYRGQNWLAVEQDRTENQCSMVRPLISKSGCTTTQVPVFIEGQGTVMSSQETCTTYNYGPEEQVCGTATYTWNGCVGSRQAPLNQQAQLTAANPIRGLVNFSCAAPLTRLTNNQSVQDAAIDALSAAGETYLPAGIMWGWRTISAKGPFGDSPVTSGADKPRRILVLMTDGENTRSQDWEYHWGDDRAAANTLTASLCSEVKADGIEVVTVAYEVTQSATIDMLKTCASGASNFYEATDASKLAAVFEAIGQSLSVVRLTR